MKGKRFLCLVGLAAAIALSAGAQQGGYRGPGAAPVTVAEAKALRDDSPVILRGKIERFLGDERYLFSDATGTITIEIDHKVWGGLSVDQNDTVELTGEIDRDYMTVEVEVRTLRKI
ncbi:MAG: NirD/YgiW/YdeI family stress tolerance protein [Treponema sp.]|jgi:uncharacterized protein (TIGR00156 family)|nr:NirD/YgiW/YdeI family stress tolerance protein [Treponema sp.]